MKTKLYCARYDFVILFYWIASFLAMTTDTLRIVIT
jgi:hypothetical protein